MKALMFGWDFRRNTRRIRHGSYGLTRYVAATRFGNYVTPKPWGDEPKFLRIIGANQIPGFGKMRMGICEQCIGNFMSPDDYYHFRNNIKYDFTYRQ